MYKYITDPNTGTQILTKSVLGRKILNNYILFMQGGAANNLGPATKIGVNALVNIIRMIPKNYVEGIETSQQRRRWFLNVVSELNKQDQYPTEQIHDAMTRYCREWLMQPHIYSSLGITLLQGNTDSLITRIIGGSVYDNAINPAPNTAVTFIHAFVNYKHDSELMGGTPLYDSRCAMRWKNFVYYRDQTLLDSGGNPIKAALSQRRHVTKLRNIALNCISGLDITTHAINWRNHFTSYDDVTMLNPYFESPINSNNFVIVPIHRINRVIIGRGSRYAIWTRNPSTIIGQGILPHAHYPPNIGISNRLWHIKFNIGPNRQPGTLDLI